MMMGTLVLMLLASTWGFPASAETVQLPIRCGTTVDFYLDGEHECRDGEVSMNQPFASWRGMAGITSLEGNQLGRTCRGEDNSAAFFVVHRFENDNEKPSVRVRYSGASNCGPLVADCQGTGNSRRAFTGICYTTNLMIGSFSLQTVEFPYTTQPAPARGDLPGMAHFEFKVNHFSAVGNYRMAALL